MRVLRIRGSSKHSNTQLLELFGSLREGNYLSRADKREVKRVEEENNIFALIIRKRHGLEITINNSIDFKVWSRVSNEGFRHADLLEQRIFRERRGGGKDRVDTEETQILSRLSTP